MDETLAAMLINGTGVITLLVAQFYMLSKGAIITRREADGITADRDMWRETAQTLATTVPQVLAEAETTNRLLRALPGIAEVDK